MKIIKLTAENIKRLKAVEIAPDGTLQVITGRNAQGKSSVLDAIWLALGGGAASRETARPVRDGEDGASVTLDLGDLTVTRTWKGDKTSLAVASADGAKYSSPQKVLDSLIGRLSFDPLEFTRLSAREQREALLDLVDLDVDLADLDARRKIAYDERTEIGRQGKALGNVPDPDPSAPAEEISAADLINQITAAQGALHRQRAERQQVEDRAAEVSRLEAELAEARGRLEQAQQVAQWHAPVADVEQLRDDLARVEHTNRAVRENAERRRRIAERDRIQEAYIAKTAEIGRLDEAKAEALANAEFPVEGLGFDDHGVTYQGVPFSQASSAEQIRVSLAMAMSLNPKLRVIRILDGSLLDADNLALIRDMAADRDYQVWVERVADGTGVGVVIEDGEVAS